MVFLLIAYIDFSPPSPTLPLLPWCFPFRLGGDCALGFSIICRQLSNANAKLAKIIYCIFNSARAVSLAKIVGIVGQKKRVQQGDCVKALLRCLFFARVCFKCIKEEETSI